MLFECLTGQAPFERETEIATVYAHMNEPPPRATRRAAGHSRGLRHRRRESAREGAGRPLRELRRAGGGERVRSAWRAAAPQPVSSPPRSRRAGRGGRRGRGRRGRHRPQRRRRRRRSQAAPRLAIAPKSMGLIDAGVAQGRRTRPVREPAVGRGVRRAPGVGAARRRAARRTRGSRVAQGALVDEAPVLPRRHRDRWRIGLGHRGRWPATRASRRDDRADREDVLGLDPGRSRCEPERHRLRGRLGLGRARAGDGARRPHRRAGPAPHPDPAGGDGRSSSPRERSGSRAPRTGGS